MRELRFTEGLRFDGEVLVDVIAVGDAPSVLFSEKARATGTVSVGHLIVNGTVRGPIRSTEMLELQQKAVIVGDVRAEMLEMHQGATIDGERRPMNAAEKPGPKPAASNPG